MNLLRILVSRQRMHLLPNIVREFEALELEARGIAEADVTVARSVGEAEQEVIARRLSEITGKQVHVQVHVDPGILGGIVVRIGDQLIDSSVAGRLQRLRQRLAV
jgi:F-type H+-transporting ATPase subunit delta